MKKIIALAALTLAVIYFTLSCMMGLAYADDEPSKSSSYTKTETKTFTQTVTVLPSTVTVYVTSPALTYTIALPGNTEYITKTESSVTSGASQTVIVNNTITKTVWRVATIDTVHTATQTIFVQNPVGTSPSDVIIKSDDSVVMSTGQVTGLSATLVTLGCLINMLGNWLFYTIGFHRGDGGNRKFMSALAESLKR